MSSEKKLSSKDAAIFKRLVKCYDEKQYKNGLRVAKQMLSNSKSGKHSETIAYKALCLNGLGRNDEALEEVKSAIKCDLKCAIAWRAYGLVVRSQRKYEESVKCFRNALKIEKDNLDNWRDLSVLQIQLRDLEGLKESRQVICQLKPTQRASWAGLAMSYHLTGDFDMALNLLENFLKSRQDVNRELVGEFMKKMFNKKLNYDYEHSELLLYQNMVIRESGNIEAALKHLQDNSASIYDKIQLQELTGTYYLLLENFQEAVKVYDELIKRNQENSLYFEHIIAAKQLTEEKEIENEYMKYKEKYPKSRTLQILILKFLNGPKFEKEIFEFLKKAIQLGNSASFKELSFIYSNKDKTRVMQNTLIKMLSTLKFFNSFDDKKKTKEPQSSFVWCHFFLSSHLDKFGRYDKALDIIETVINTEKDNIELLILKAKILKHKDEIEKAAKVMIDAHLLDPLDKSLGCKCAKYMIRAGQIDKALALLKTFDVSKDEENDSPCHWLLLELGKAYLKKEDYHSAIERCLELKKSFESIWEDQLDFHVFSLTRIRLCSYVELLRLEDEIYQNKDYEQTAQIAISILLKVFDNKSSLINTNKNNNNQSTNGTKKKGKNKSKNNHKTSDTCTKLLSENLIKDPLEEASKFLQPLLEMFSQHLSTHLSAFEIYWRKKKPLMMLQTVLRMQAIDKSNQKVIETVTKFYDYVSKNKSNFSEDVITVIKQINV